MFNRHEVHCAPAPDQLSFIDPSVPSRACCCPARPAVKVTMPPAAGRPRPVDLWLCGHHYRASSAALLLAGALVEDIDVPRGEPCASRVPAMQQTRNLSAEPSPEAARLHTLSCQRWPRPGSGGVRS